MKKIYCEPVAKIEFYTTKDIVTESFVETNPNDVFGNDVYDGLFD